MASVPPTERRAETTGERLALKMASDTVEQVGKLTKPAWSIFMFLIVLGGGLGKFYYEWQDTATNGSPAVKEMLNSQRLVNESTVNTLNALSNRMDRTDDHVKSNTDDIKDIKSHITKWVNPQ